MRGRRIWSRMVSALADSGAAAASPNRARSSSIGEHWRQRRFAYRKRQERGQAKTECRGGDGRDWLRTRVIARR